MSTNGIVPTFDPDTGASGGPAPATPGVSLSNVPFQGPVDLSDGWTLLDPDSLVKTGPSFSAGFNTITFNALAAGSSDYQWAAGANHRSPRWYIPLTAPDASGNDVRITSDDTFVLEVIIKNGTPLSEFSTSIVCGLASDPTSTLATTILGAGGQVNYSAGGNRAYGAWTINAGTTGLSASNVRGITSTLCSGLRIGATAYITLDSSDLRVLDGNRNANQSMTTGTDLFLMVGVGTRNSADTIAENDDVDFQVYYRVVKFTLP